jgi:putative hydrolase of the HAD superfamily
MKIESVIFDYGNVISQPQREDCVAAMASLCGVEQSKFDKGYWQFRLEYDRNMDNFTYFSNVAEAAGVRLSIEQIQQLTLLDNESWTLPCQTMLSWIKMLESHGIPIALLSNMPYAMSEYLELNCDWLPRFKNLVFSARVGYVKPEKEIYELCLREAGMNAPSTLFIDDRLENIHAAEAVGMIGLHYTGIAEAFKTIRERFDLPYPLLI